MADIKPAGDNLSKGILWKIALPILLGVGVAVWLFIDDFRPEIWREIQWDFLTVIGIAGALIFVFGRDFGMAWRFRALTDRQLHWSQAARVTMLVEFTSAITPSAVGGSAFGMLFLSREGIKIGRATTLMMTTLLLDELFFTLLCPVILIFISHADLFGFAEGKDMGGAFAFGLETAFWCIYGVIVVWTAILFAGIIVSPRTVKKLLMAIMRLKLLKRWHDSMERTTDTMVQTSCEIRGRSMRWWAEAFAATATSWLSRFLTVNMLFVAFASLASQLAVFGRQFVVWVILMVTPTPGGSGVSEWLFTEYYGDLIGSAALALVIALFWRLISYYVYLLIGVCILPSWLRGTMRNRHTKK